MRALQGWRRELFGDMALKLVRGEICLKFDHRRIRAIAAQEPEEPAAE